MFLNWLSGVLVWIGVSVPISLVTMLRLISLDRIRLRRAEESGERRGGHELSLDATGDLWFREIRF